ncbi:DoxX family protein [Pseudonocardia sp.]|uniref:DoxX family protein n=1 Tax=Pseudonocardia sp. TaxID=60912 RepID=UPI003D13F72B
MTTSTAPTPSRLAARTVLVLRVLVGLFLIVASALPKLFGETYAVQIFDQIGAGDWFRYFIGIVELAGGIGLLIPALAGPAAVGIILLMVGAGITQVWILDQPAYVITPIIIGLLAAVIARHQFRYRRQAG